MAMGRKIAMIYVFAVPAIIGVVLFQRATYLRVATEESRMSAAAEVLHNCDLATTLLKEPDLNAGGPVDVSDNPAGPVGNEQLSEALQRLAQLTANEPSVQAQVRVLNSLAARRSALIESVATLRNEGTLASRLHAAEAEDHRLRDGIAEALSPLRTSYQVALQRQGAGATQNLRIAGASILYGGFLSVWLVGAAAMLLFHDEKARTWTGIERRVHTRILQELPLPVCLTTKGGVILYSNPAQDVALGYQPGELLGKNVTSLIGPTDFEPALEDVLDRLGPNQNWSGDLELRRTDRTRVETEASITNLEVAGRFYRLYVQNPHSSAKRTPEVEPLVGARVN